MHSDSFVPSGWIDAGMLGAVTPVINVPVQEGARLDCPPTGLSVKEVTKETLAGGK